MSTTTTHVDVSCPIRTVYDQWTQFEDFPRFMEGIESVRQLDDATLAWTAEIAGQRRSWKARVVDQVPDQRVSWESIDGARNAGVVQFERLEDGQTRVFLDLEFEPEGLIETAGDKLGFVSRRAEADLERFKAFIEAKRQPTGAWRGTIQDGDTETTSGTRTPTSTARGSSTGGTGYSVGSERTAGMVTGMGTGLSSGMGAGLGPETAGTRPVTEELTGLERDDDFVRDTIRTRGSVSGMDVGPADPATT